jgi:hypothetical protein
MSQADSFDTINPSRRARPAARFSTVERLNPKPAQQIPESVATAHADFLTRIATLRPNRIVYNADRSDLEERAEHLQAILNATALYCAEVVADTVYCSEPGLIDGKYLVGLISDLAGDVVGGLLNASEEMQGVAR